MAKMRVFSVVSVQLDLLKSNPPQLSVNVSGLATTAGWSGPELRTVEEELSPDGILDLEFVAEPPDGVVPQVISPIAASTIWTTDVERVVAVRVISRTNDPIQFVRRDREEPSTPAVGEEGPTTLPLGEEDLFPTTLAVGEEGPPPTTLAVGEEGPPPTTLAVGEEGPPPTTLAVGEEGPPPTTLAVGEEGPPTTLAVGEEGPPPTTPAVGEEGPFPTTFALGEEGPTPTTLALGEEGPLPTTLALGEEGPLPTTPAVGEEGPGPKTLALGEEGPFPTTQALGEEGGGSPFEPGKGVVGEGPDLFSTLGGRNPFGRR